MSQQQMSEQQMKFGLSRGARLIAAACSALTLSMTMAAPAEARGSHLGSFHHGLGGHETHGGDGSGSFAGDRRHGNDTHVNAASEEEDKLLNTKIKSICHGC